MCADEQSAFRVVRQIGRIGGELGGVDDVDLRAVDPDALDGGVVLCDARPDQDSGRVVIDVVEHAVEVVGRPVRGPDPCDYRKASDQRELEVIEAAERGDKFRGRRSHEMDDRGVVTRHGRPAPSSR